jgi:hypothetical protein
LAGAPALQAWAWVVARAWAPPAPASVKPLRRAAAVKPLRRAAAVSGQPSPPLLRFRPTELPRPV